MFTLVLATNNKDKIKEIKVLLKGLAVEILTLKDFPSFPKIKETGKTLEENAVQKAQSIFRFTGKISLADDSGLEVDALEGLPGVKSARFAGPGCGYADNNKKLLKLMQGIPWNKRKATFRCVMALAFPDENNPPFIPPFQRGKQGDLKAKIILRQGRIRGYITTEIKGNQGFGYDPIFYVPKYKKTFAEIGLAIKNKISHRAQALQKIRKVIFDTLSTLSYNSYN